MLTEAQQYQTERMGELQAELDPLQKRVSELTSTIAHLSSMTPTELHREAALAQLRRNNRLAKEAEKEAEDEKRAAEDKRREPGERWLSDAHANALFQSERRGKGMLPSGSNKSTSYLYGVGFLGGLAAKYVANGLHIHNDLLLILLAVVGFILGGLLGAWFHDSQFVTDPTWVPPIMDRSWDEYRERSWDEYSRKHGFTRHL